MQVTSLGPMAVKGLPGPVEVYELAGVGAARTRLQAAAARGLTRFVGRDAEVEQLRRALEQVRHGATARWSRSWASRAWASRASTYEFTHSASRRRAG